jgi:hypothetical protein
MVRSIFFPHVVLFLMESTGIKCLETGTALSLLVSLSHHASFLVSVLLSVSAVILLSLLFVMHSTFSMLSQFFFKQLCQK